MKLDIVIPAYNEEAAIEAIIRRCLDARAFIVEKTPLDAVTVTVVSDGSSDRTAEIARSFEPDITVIAYEKNQGYGAAIKQGFAGGDGELVGFLDADGTCDPTFFAVLVQNVVEHNASLCIGSRMGADSKMPPIRKLGNRIWRCLINWMAQSRITDAASGMRVMRRDVLRLLEPLPDGLHYTPTMSCRATLDARLTMLEVPMAYEERVGRSKLSVVADGLRFLKTILDVGLTYQPFRLISLPGIALQFFALLLILPVGIHYAFTHVVQEGHIYRILTVLVAAGSGFQMFLAGLASERVVDLVHPKKWGGGRFLSFMRNAVTQKRLLGCALLFVCLALALNFGGIVTFLAEGHVYIHWSRVAVGGLLVAAALQCCAAAVLDRVLMLLRVVPQAGTPNAP